MRKPFSSMAIGLTLLSTVTLPSLVLMVFHTSSMAAGLLVILGLYICLFVALSALGHKFYSLGASAILITVVLGVIMIQSTISLVVHDDFDFDRFSQTYLFWSINNFTVIFCSMSENWFFPTHRQYPERHCSVRTPSWTAIALVGEVC